MNSFFGPDFVCTHKVLLSFLMSGVSIVLIFLAFAAAVAMVMGIVNGGEKVLSLVSNKISSKFSQETVQKSQKWILIILGCIAAFFILCIAITDTKVLFLTLAVVLGYVALIGACIFGTGIYTDWTKSLAFSSPKLYNFISSVERIIFGVIVGSFLICVCWGIYDLLNTMYMWWIVKICGA